MLGHLHALYMKNLLIILSLALYLRVEALGVGCQ